VCPSSRGAVALFRVATRCSRPGVRADIRVKPDRCFIASAHWQGDRSVLVNCGTKSMQSWRVGASRVQTVDVEYAIPDSNQFPPANRRPGEGVGQREGPIVKSVSQYPGRLTRIGFRPVHAGKTARQSRGTSPSSSRPCLALESFFLSCCNLPTVH